jgi:hypothetical protein
VRRPRALMAVAPALVGLALAACGGGDDEKDKKASPPASESPSGGAGGGATPPGPSALPPGLAECYAKKGYKLESPADIHSAPPQVVQECFQALHQGSGAP